MVFLSIIVPTAGRDSLNRTLASITGQLEAGDEIIVSRNDGQYGNQARDSAMQRALGSHLLFIDDDDVYAEGALAVVRSKLREDPKRVHIFRMRYPDGATIWREPVVRMCNVGTPMVVIPNNPGKLGHWDNGYGAISDLAFFGHTLSLRGDEPVFHEDVIALVGP